MPPCGWVPKFVRSPTRHVTVSAVACRRSRDVATHVVCREPVRASGGGRGRYVTGSRGAMKLSFATKAVFWQASGGQHWRSRRARRSLARSTALVRACRSAGSMQAAYAPAARQSLAAANAGGAVSGPGRASGRSPSPRRLVPVDIAGGEEAEPAQEVHPIRALSRSRPAARGELGEIGTGSRDRCTRRVEEPVGLEGITSRLERAHQGHHQPAQVDKTRSGHHVRRTQAGNVVAPSVGQALSCLATSGSSVNRSVLGRPGSPFTCLASRSWQEKPLASRWKNGGFQ